MCAARLLQGGAAHARQQRAPGPPLQQRGDRVDHQGAGWHAALRTAGQGRVRVLLNELPTKSHPCLERETPLESSCSHCGLLTTQHYFVYVVGLFYRPWRFQRRTDTACTLCSGHWWAIFLTNSLQPRVIVDTAPVSLVHPHNWLFVYLLAPRDIGRRQPARSAARHRKRLKIRVTRF